MKIIFAGGGTGGHLFSGIALAQAFLKQDSETKDEVLFVGTPYGLEKELVPRYGLRLEYIPAKPLKGKNLWQRLKGLFALPYALLKAFALLRKEKPDFVFGIGGYASGPVVLMAALLRIRTAIIEQNSYPGFTNRVLGKFVRFIFIAFEKARTFFPAQKVHLTGNPLRTGFGEQLQTAQEKTAPFTLLILGGSQGAHAINQAMQELAQQLGSEKETLKIIHQTGKQDCEAVQKTYQNYGIQAEVFDFIHQVEGFYQQADLVIARAGAGTLTELTVMGKPSILIPYPFAADDHQRFNAQELVEANAARLILNQDLNGPRLLEEILSLKNQPETLEVMGHNAKAKGHPLAAQEILKICQV